MIFEILSFINVGQTIDKLQQFDDTKYIFDNLQMKVGWYLIFNYKKLLFNLINPCSAGPEIKYPLQTA